MNTRELETGVLVCRDLRHAWQVVGYYSTDGKVAKAGPITRVLVCSRCSTRRTDVVNSATGEIQGRGYFYQEGYLLKYDSGEPRLRSQDFRRELINRTRKAGNIKDGTA